MKIVNVSMIAVALMTAGATAAFARGGVHIGVAQGDGAVNSYVVTQPDGYTVSSTGAAVRQYQGLDQQSATVLRLEESRDDQIASH